MIRATVHPDDHAVEVHFDATPWFAASCESDILALAECGWGGDMPADNVAYFMEDVDKKVAEMFAYVHVAHEKKGIGFECYVNEEDARAWLEANRPGIVIPEME